MKKKIPPDADFSLSGVCYVSSLVAKKLNGFAKTQSSITLPTEVTKINAVFI